jgi:hypothetical protein|nr:NUDIX domain-containing protein [Neorhizobium tomejilense]
MKTLAQALEIYRSELLDDPRPGQWDQAARCLNFLANDTACFERSNMDGHFTGSALIVDDRERKTLLCHHVKYDQWVQTGGHCDGVKDPFFTAWQEGYQESGLKDIRPLSPWNIADVNVTRVAAYRDVPEHWHYDIRYIFAANWLEPISVSDESHDVRWVDVSKLRDYTDEEALLRLAERHFGAGSTRA